MGRYGYVMDATAWCSVCGKQWRNPETARDHARIHNRKTGHETVAEQVRVYTYQRSRQRGERKEGQ